MKNFWIVTGVILVTCLIFVAESLVRGGDVTVILGMPTIGAGTQARPAWIALGGFGVIVLGAGVGIVAFTIAGAGALFATGQIAVGLVAFGQAAVGLVCFFAQLGVGMMGGGQVAIGGLVSGQGHLGFDGAEFLERLSADLNAVLRFW